MDSFSTRERYINFYTDFAFKRLFGTEVNKEKPRILQEEVFTRLFDAAEIAKFSPQEVYEYEESLKIYRDWYSMSKTAVDKAKKEGREEGFAEGKAEGKSEETLRVAKLMKINGSEAEYISVITGLPISEIDRL